MIVRHIRPAALAVADFVAGDDWLPAAGVVIGLGLTALLARATSSAAWWAAPVVVIVVLVVSALRAGRNARKA